MGNNGRNVSVLLNTTATGATSATFAPQVTFPTGDARSVSIGDINGDGKPDIAVANKASDTASILLNTTTTGATTPTFAPQVTFATGDGPYSVSIGDINGDGKPDIAVANTNSNTASILLNTTTTGATTPTFATKVDFTTGRLPDNVSIGDINGDGKPDLAVANINTNTASILLNTTTPVTPTPTPSITPTPTPVTPTPTPSITPTPTPVTPTPPTPPTPTPRPSIPLNNPPTVNRGRDTTPWHYQNLRVGNSSQFEYTIPFNAFIDRDPGDILTYSATLANGQPLPSWLNFNPNTRTFSGNPSTLQRIEIKLTATDRAGASASDRILLNVNSSGVVIDSYIAGATLFLDANKNSILDASEPFTTTGSRGEFELDIPFEIFDINKNGELDPSEGNLVAIGGTDIATGLPLETPVTAPTDATVVTLLTSLVADAIDRGIDPEIATDQVRSTLALPANIDLLNLDPIAATNSQQPGGVETLAAMVKVQNFITQTANLFAGASIASMAAITEEVVSAIGDRIQSNSVLNLSNATALQPIIEQAAGKMRAIDPNFDLQKILPISQQAATVMAAANQRVDSVVVNFIPSAIPTEIARVQKVALGKTAQDLKAVTAGNKTIELAVAGNTETALINQIQGVTAPDSPAVPIVTGETEIVSNAPNAIEGTNSDDNLIGTIGSDIFIAKRGNDFIDGNSGNDTIYGGKGGDYLFGSSGDDILYGNRGTDTLIGGAGDDTLVGGKGSDIFVLVAGQGFDIVADFVQGQDLIGLSGGLSFSQLAITQDSQGALIKNALTGQSLGVLSGVSAIALTSVNFIQN